MTGLFVQRAGLLTLLEDLGRPGYAALGVTGSGAWDRAAARLANRLLGNPEAAACLEVLAGDLVLCAAVTTSVAVTGAEVPLLVDGVPAPLFAPVPVITGQVIELGRPRRGLRTYLAVRGGFEGERLLGSLASDPTAGLGPAPVAPGVLLPVGAAPPDPVFPSDLAPATRPAGDLVLGALLGPRDAWFTPEALTLLGTADWVVTAETSRVGTRLAGPTLARAHPGELDSEPLVRGAVQVPTGGQPLVFGPDHPTTGGYPVVAVVDDADADRLAQAEPGTRVRFRLRRGAL